MRSLNLTFLSCSALRAAFFVPHERDYEGQDADTIQRNEKVDPTERWCFLLTAFAAKHGRGDWIRTSDLAVPNRALYQAKLHPVN